MPYEWVEPEVAAEVDGRKIYHTYRDNGMVSDCWFTTDASQDDADGWYDEPDYRFDIYDVPGELRQQPIKEQLEHIIRNNLVPFPEDNHE